MRNDETAGPGTSALAKARFRIAGFGSAYPAGIVTNRDLAVQLGVDVNWIESRCGIQSRCVAEPGETTHSLAVAAAAEALARESSFRPDCLICATFTPEYRLCPVAPSIASSHGLGPIAAFDLNAKSTRDVFVISTTLSWKQAGAGNRSRSVPTGCIERLIV